MNDYFFKNVLIISDNRLQCTRILRLIKRIGLEKSVNFTWACSKYSSPEGFTEDTGVNFCIVDLKKAGDVDSIIARFPLVISVHCKQLFPEILLSSVMCINIHPGYNPDNRGWYPQVFSIINNTVIGATIHIIDNELDHGPVIDRVQVPRYGWDTSKEIYERVLEAELALFEKNIDKILQNRQEPYFPEGEGNLYLKRDFNALCNLDLGEVNTFQFFLDKLRALSHGDFKNAYFIDPQTRKKIFVNIRLIPEE